MLYVIVKYGTVQLQLHIITRTHVCPRVLHGKSCHVSRYVAACPTAMSNIVMHVHVWKLIATRL